MKTALIWFVYNLLLIPVNPANLPGSFEPYFNEHASANDSLTLDSLFYQVKVKKNQDQLVLDKAYELSVKLKNHDYAGYLAIEKGYRLDGDLEESLHWYEKALVYYHEIADSSGICESLIFMGAARSQMGNLDGAASAYYEAAEIANLTQDSLRLAQTMTNLAILDEENGEDDRAKKKYFSALKLLKGDGAERRKTRVYNNLGLLYIKSEQYDSALLCLHNCLSFYKKRNDHRRLVKAMANMGWIYKNIGHYDSAEYYAQLAISKNKGLNDQSIRMGKNYALLGKINFHRKNYDEAERYFKMAERNAKLNKGNYFLLSVLKDLSLTYERKGNFKYSNDYYKKILILNDSITLFENESTYKELTTKYETEKKEKLIEEQEAELARQREEMAQRSHDSDMRIKNLYVLILVLIAVGIFIFFKSKTEKLKKTEELLVARVNNLKNQLSPHFLFNSLNVLSSLVYKKPEDAEVFIGELSGLYRYILENIEKKVVPLKDEVQFVKSFFEILKVRYGNKIVFETTLKKENSLCLPPLALQILLENAIKHNSLSRENVLKISLRQIDDQWLEFENNRLPKSGVDSTQLGLSILDKVYASLGKKRIKIIESEQVFMIRLPVFALKESVI